MYNLLVIVTMWNKVNELSRQSYSQAQLPKTIEYFVTFTILATFAIHVL